MSNNPFDNCDECPWPGKCRADETCWLEVEWKEDKPADEPEKPSSPFEPSSQQE